MATSRKKTRAGSNGDVEEMELSKDTLEVSEDIGDCSDSSDTDDDDEMEIEEVRHLLQLYL